MMTAYGEQRVVADAMQRFGGGFVSALGAALERADDFNAQRIRDAFPDYWLKYLELARARDGRALVKIQGPITRGRDGRSLRPAEPEVIRDMLGLVTAEAHYALLEALDVASWSQEERDAVADWAGAIHLRASDNEVTIPPRPACVPEWVRP